jgi:pSer/pThr/pTyr-binding forkhead associated (FHA) protein
MTTDDYLLTQIAHIIHLNPQVGPAEYALNAERIEIGRSPLCQIVIKSPRISRRHACIERAGLRYEIYDLGSTNSTFVNDRQLAIGEHYWLRHDDYIGLGSSDRLLQFIDPDPTEESNRLRYIRHTKKFSFAGKELTLTPNERLMLIHLYERIGQLCSYSDCAKAVWNETFEADFDKTRLQRLICDLRARLEGTNVEIEAQPRLGYILRLISRTSCSYEQAFKELKNSK